MNNEVNFIKFSIVGAVNTIIDISIFVFLLRVMEWDPLWSNFVSYVAAVINSYIMNMLWTFRFTSEKNLNASTFLMFVSINSMGLIIGTTVIFIFQPIIPEEISKLIAVFLTLVWNFFGIKYFVVSGVK